MFIVTINNESSNNSDLCNRQHAKKREEKFNFYNILPISISGINIYFLFYCIIYMLVSFSTTFEHSLLNTEATCKMCYLYSIFR